ncbi:hypothetical protein Bca101_071165 [Brassica carinata]
MIVLPVYELTKPTDNTISLAMALSSGWDPVWEGLMSPQTETKATFRVTPQPGVPPEEAGAAVAAESSIGGWTTVWTDGLTSLDCYKGRCYHIEPVPGEENQFIAYVAYPLDFFEEGSVTNMFTSIVGNGPPHGIQVEREKLNKYGRPLLGCTIKPKLGLSAKNCGRAVYECLRGGLDFTKDDENVNSQPFMRWRDHFLFCAEAIYKAQAETGEIKGHYLNATAGTCEEMIKRAVFARELGVPIVMHDYLTGGFTANTSLAHYCRDNGPLLHIHRTMHAIIDRQKNHGMHFCVLAKALRLSGGDHIHAGTVIEAAVSFSLKVGSRYHTKRLSEFTGLVACLDFFAMIFPVVRIGAIAVSFLFVVMMFHIQIAEIHEEIMKAFHYYQPKEIRPLLDIRFMPESLILLVAMIGAIVLTMHRTTKITKGKEEVCFKASEKQRRMAQHIGRKGGLFPVKVFSIHWTQHSSKENIRQIAALDLQGKEILAD